MQNDQLNEINRQFDEGDISLEEAMNRRDQVMAEQFRAQAQQEASAAVQNALRERDAQHMTNQFMEENPEFRDLQADGTLQQIRQENPMHDDFSAFFAWKGQQARRDGEQAGQDMRNERDRSKVIVGSSGMETRVEKQVDTSNWNDTDYRNSGLEVLKKVRRGR